MTREELFAYIDSTYNVQPEYPWATLPEAAVFRHGDNQKWFALVMGIPRKYAYGEPGPEVAAVNLKCDPILQQMMQGEPGILPAYHMNKTHWVTALLDGSADGERIIFLLHESFELTRSKRKK